MKAKYFHDILDRAINDKLSRGTNDIIRPLQIVFFKGYDLLPKTVSVFSWLSNLTKGKLFSDVQFYDIGILVNRSVLPILSKCDFKRNGNVANGKKHMYVWKCSIKYIIPSEILKNADKLYKFFPFMSEYKIKDCLSDEPVEYGSVIRSLEDMIKLGKSEIYVSKYSGKSSPFDKYKLSDIQTIMTNLYKKYGKSKMDCNPVRLFSMCFPIADTILKKNKFTSKMIVDDDKLISPELISIILNKFKIVKHYDNSKVTVSDIITDDDNILEPPILINSKLLYI